MLTINKDVVPLAVAIALGVVASLTLLPPQKQVDEANPASRRKHEDKMELVGPAGNLERMVESSDVVLIGTLDSISDDGLYDGYSGNTFLEVQTPTPFSPGLNTPTLPPLSALPFTDFVIDDEMVIKDDVSTAEWTLRMVTEGAASTTAICSMDFAVYPPGNIAERYLFFLKQNPDDSYGLYHGPYDRIILGEEITYSDCDKTPVDFATGLDEEEFVDAVETQVAVPTRTPTFTPTP